MQTPVDIDALARDGRAALDSASTPDELEAARVAVVGRSAPLVLALRSVGSLPPEERGPTGQRLNAARRELEALADERREALERAALEARLADDRVDVTLPPPVVPHGGLHVLTQTRREIENVFLGLGYRIAEGPEVETEWHNFTALNFAEDHPAKAETRHALDPPGRAAADAHLAGAGPRDGANPPPVYVIVPGPRVPARHAGRDPLARSSTRSRAWPSTGG